MKAVVMAGGEGARLRPLTCTLAKPMIKLMDRPVLGHVFELLIENGFDEIAVTTRYRSEDIESFIEAYEADAEIYCVPEEKVLGTAGSVKNAAREWDEPFLVICGDCICDIELSKVMLYHKSIMADATIVCSTVVNPCEYNTVNLNRNGSVDSLSEKPDWSHNSSDLADTGIYVINPAVLDMIPDNVHYDFTGHLFPDMMNEGKRLYGYQTDAYWCDIADIKSLRMCIRDMMSHKIKVNMPDCKNGIFSEGKVPDGDYTIVPPVYIGRNVHIGENSVIGPFTVLGNGVSVSENTRIKKSVIGRNTNIGSNCDLIGAVTGDNSTIKSNSVCLEGSCIGDGCVINSGSTINNNVNVWPSKNIPYRSVVMSDLRDGQNEFDLLDGDGISGVTFSELSCERCCRLGEAVASSSCGGKVGIGYDGTKASKALAMAVLSGLISGGSMISDFGVCFASQMGFFVSFRSLDCGIYISANPKKTQINLFGAYGMPLGRKYEREIESRYKRSDFRRCSGMECNDVRDMSSVADVYDGQLLTLAGESLSGLCVTVKSPNSMIRHSAEKCLYLLGADESPLPEFSVDYTGKIASARDENGRLITHEQLLLCASVYELEKGRNICVPFTAPVCIDDMAQVNKAVAYRIGQSPMSEAGENEAVTSRRCIWGFDGLSLVFKVLGIMKKQSRTLASLVDSLPTLNIVSRTVISAVPHYRIAYLIGADVGKDSRGIRKTDNKGSVAVIQTGAGRLLRIVAEADTMEAAKELCDFTEKKINGDSLDIYHHKV